jgi:hypothetical protein
MIPHASLLVFKPSEKTDIAHVADALSLDIRIKALATKSSQAAVHRNGTWKLSTTGEVAAASLHEHISWLFDVAIRENKVALEKLRGEGYWISVVFHDYVPPDPVKRALIDQELELLGITFDFELERR